MGSLVAEVTKKKAMWLYPKVMGFDPSERWGHSACFSKGLMYVFGGCCGGKHFSDVLTLDLDKMVWSKLATTGEKPGPRDSHSAVVVGNKMIVFGGTNGFKKVNHIHVLDLVTKEWVRPECKGTHPSPRESHTATLLSDERLVIFGGSGEGNGNYLNDLHILDLRTMRWTSPELKGDLPVPRDSHSTLAIGNKLIVYGGDSADQYHGNVHVLDMSTMTWSRLTVQGSSPGVRAGHAAVNIGTKVYVIGGVGDKHYYNDVWIFDICTCSWTQLNIHGQQPQGRFSHTAVVADMDIAIYGGCGEDEHPLNELLVLQLGEEHPNGRSYISMCKVFGTYWNQEKKIIPRGADTNSNSKRRRIAAAKVWDVESEQEERFLSLSLHSSPSQSDQEQTPGQKANVSLLDSQQNFVFKQINQIPTNCQHDSGSSIKRALKNIQQRSSQDLHFLEHQLKREKCLHVHEDRKGAQHLIGAEVCGEIDGACDSGLPLPAAVNGRTFSGVLFAPGLTAVVSRGTSVEPYCSLTRSFFSTKPFMKANQVDYLRASQQASICLHAECCHGSRQAQVAPPFPFMRGTPAVSKEHKIRSDLQGLVLTLGGPASGNP